MTEAPRQDEDDDDDHPYTIKRRKRVFPLDSLIPRICCKGPD